jgi:hypothetical protein
MKFDKIDWSKAFFKTYLEKRSFLHLLVNFNRIWVMHIAVFWIYTAWNSPSIYAQKNSTTATRPMIYSMSALGGAVACLIMIVATLAEFSYIPTTWNNTSHLARRLIFLLIILAITGAPSIYIAFFDQDSHLRCRFLRHCSLWPNVWRPSSRQEPKVSGQSNIHRILPSVDSVFSNRFYLTLGLNLRAEVCRIVLLLDVVFP